MVTINGRTYKGDSLRIDNNKIYIDGKLIDDTIEDTKTAKKSWFSMFKSAFDVSKQLLTTIEISGDVKINATNSNIRVIGDITVDAENAILNSNIICNSLRSKGDVNCGDITTDSFSANNVQCGDVNADDVNVSSIECGDLNCDDLKSQHMDVRGDLNCDDINTSIINVQGDVNCGDIDGNVKASEINAGTIHMKNE
jgi:hypothetical protein